MQTFHDTVTLAVYAFEDDVVVTNTAGVYSFRTADGTPLDLPATLQPFVPPPPPPPSPEVLAAAELATRIGNGIAIISTGTPALNATYALDDVSTAQIYQLGLFASQFDTFPGGATQPYPDATGVPRTFSVTQFVAFLRAVAPLVSALTTQAAVLAHGGVPAWPAQTATIA